MEKNNDRLHFSTSIGKTHNILLYIHTISSGEFITGDVILMKLKFGQFLMVLHEVKFLAFIIDYSLVLLVTSLLLLISSAFPKMYTPCHDRALHF